MIWIIFAAASILLSFWLFEFVSELFVKGAGSVSRHYNIPEAIVGASVAAVGTSGPELGTSIFAVAQGVPTLGIGAIVGSAIFNLTIILAIVGLTTKCRLEEISIRREGLFYIISTLILFAFIEDGLISQIEALSLFGIYIIYFYLLYVHGKEGQHVPKKEFEYVKYKLAIPYTILGLAGIIGVSHLLVTSSIYLINNLGLSASLFGMIVVAIGTSMPEIFVSLKAAKKGFTDLAVSNAIGSNIFDILVAIGIPLSFRASTPVEQNIGFAAPFLLISVVFVFILIKRGNNITKKDSLILIGVYALFLALLFLL